MIAHPVVIAAFMLVGGATAALAQKAGLAQAARYDSVFDALMALPQTMVRAAAVSNVMLRRDAATFVLESGRVYLLGPVDGRTVAAAFVGQGRFSFRAPNRVETEQLTRRFKTPQLDRAFRSLFLLFADSTALELERQLQFAPTTGAAGSAAKDGLGYVSHRGRRYVDSHVMGPFLNGTWNQSFVALVRGAADGPFLFQVDPFAPEEISLSVSRAGEAQTDNGSTLVSQFHWSGDSLPAQTAPRVPKERFSVNRYTIDATIAGNLDFTARAALTLEWWDRPDDWFPLVLPYQLTVDSVRWDGAAGAATVARPKNNSVLWVRRPAGEPPWPALAVYYHGDLIRAIGPYLNLNTSSGWYPAPGAGYGHPATATFDLTFHTPRKYQFVSIGDRADSSVTGDVLTTRWVTTAPTVHASFSVGKFVVYAVKSTQLQNARPVPVTMYINSEAHGWRPGRTPSSQREPVGEDVALSLNFFRDAFGDPPVRSFAAAEIAGGHGQAFPGLIHLSWVTYGLTPPSWFVKGQDESFRSHEVAHQWWGLGVQPRTYRDAWLSEGFAEFASWWYTETLLGDTAAVSRMLQRSREALLARRKHAGPIALGTRLIEGDAPQDYPLNVYHKGAWTLRMLRFFMVEPDSTGEAPFRAMIRDFYDSYQGGQASTEDFRAVVERHTGIRMDWFFDQWVYGTGIPTYEWRHTTREEAGKQMWKLVVEQSNVPDDFTMLVPVRLYFPDGQDAFLRVLVKGARSEYAVQVPTKPLRVEFNAWQGVLADVKESGWR